MALASPPFRPPSRPRSAAAALFASASSTPLVLQEFDQSLKFPDPLLDVRGFPTYLIVDADGTILFNGNGPFPMLRCMTERTVAGEDPNCSPADWQ